jgi:hypothetical protein
MIYRCLLDILEQSRFLGKKRHTRTTVGDGKMGQKLGEIWQELAVYANFQSGADL